MKNFSHCILILTIVVYSTLASISCGTFEKSSICFDYVNNDAHNYNQSNQITEALENVIDIVNGSYCRERITAFLCNYYFPHCENNANITPICEQSCSEYLLTGICANHFFNLLNALNDGNYPNVSVNRLLQYNCSPPYDITVSNNCTLLTGILNARDHVQCVPSLTNGTCNTIENYAVDVAQVELHIALVNALESARLAVLGSDIDPSCITRLDWIICLYRFPPCRNFTLLLVCVDDCGELINFFAICGSIEEHVNNQTIRDTFTGLRCRVPESYYDGYVERQFTYDDDCTDAPTGPITSMSPTTNDTINTDESSGSTDTNGIIIGAVLSTCVMIFIVMALLMIYCRRKKRKLPKNNLDASHNHMAINNQVASSPTTASERLFHEFEEAFAGEIVNPRDLIINEEIGKGAFGIVCKGVYTKETDTDTEVLDVAIKTLREVQASKTEQFIKECIIAKKFNHPNILNLIGVSFLKEGGMPMMILPFMHNGDVKSFVQSKRGNILEVTEYPEGLDYNILAKICLDIANGMEYLSSLRCVHRDLAARNCMLDENMIAKVADFGFSRDVYLTDYYRIRHNTRLPVKWLAPEALIDRVFTTQSDVWSFGVTCWEIFTLGLEPYPTVNVYNMVNYLKSKIILDKPFLSSGKMYEIMKSCWKFEPEDRPTFSLIVEQLNQQHPQFVEPHE